MHYVLYFSIFAFFAKIYFTKMTSRSLIDLLIVSLSVYVEKSNIYPFLFLILMELSLKIHFLK